jgi:hypothetical protein
MAIAKGERSTDLSELKARILKALTDLKPEFKSASALGLKKSEKSSQALGELVSEGRVKRFGAGRAVYRLAERCSQSDLDAIVADKIRTLRHSSTPSLIPLSLLDDALTKVPVALRDRKMDVLRQLADAKEVLLLKHGRIRFLIFTAGLVDYLQSPRSQSDLSERVHSAYASVSAEQRTPDVPISDLYSRVGGSLREFHDFLTQACLEHRAVPTSGEPVFASHSAKERALVIEGKMFLNIKFI